jgi:hypothetical protein
MRLESGDMLASLDAIFQLCPVLKSILSRQDELSVGQQQRPIQDRLRGSAPVSRMIGRYSRGGGDFSIPLIAQQLFGL